MNHKSTILPLALIPIVLFGCSRSSKFTVADIEESLTAQFKQEWVRKRTNSDKGEIKKVHIEKFRASGDGFSYVTLDIFWDKGHLGTSSQMIPLGNSAFGVSIRLLDSEKVLNAIIVVPSR